MDTDLARTFDATDLVSRRGDVRARAIDAVVRADPEPHKRLALAILAADADRPRLELVQALGSLAPAPYALAAAMCLARGSVDVIPLVARGLAARWHELPVEAHDGLVRLLEGVRARHPAPLVELTVDEVLAASPAPGAALALLARLPTVAPKAAARLLAALTLRSDDVVREAIPALLEAVERRPRLLTVAARLWGRVAALADESARARVFQLAAEEFAAPAALPTHRMALLPLLDATAGDGCDLDPGCLADLCDVLAPAGQAAACRLIARVGTEDAAHVLFELGARPELAAAARAAALSLRSPFVAVVDQDGSLSVVATYVAPDGEPLVLEQGAMRHARTNEPFALDERGRPTLVSATRYGACTCCVRPRGLVEVDGVVHCPRSGTLHGPQPADEALGVADDAAALVDEPVPGRTVAALALGGLEVVQARARTLTDGLGASLRAVTASVASAIVGERFPPAPVPVWVHQSWTMRPLGSPAKLVEEGAAMRHCVGRFAERCRHGGSTIYSLTCDGDVSRSRALTVELRASRIVQVSGRFNRAAGAEEQTVLELWAREHRLMFA